MPIESDSLTRETVLNILRRQGFVYRRQAERTTVWRRPDDPVEVYVPRKEKIPAGWLTCTLRQCGISEQEIEEIVAACAP